jgi:hypothetical protein
MFQIIDTGPTASKNHISTPKRAMSSTTDEDKKNVDHFYTTDPTGELAPKMYMYEGIAGYVYLTPGVDRIPIYRFFNSGLVDHFYTESKGEADAVGNQKSGYVRESICSHPTASLIFPTRNLSCWIPAACCNRADIVCQGNHAWYSPRSGGGAFVEFKRYYWDTPYYDHFYTANQSGTADALEDKAVVKAEAEAGYIYPVSEGVCECALRAKGLYPLYRWCRPESLPAQT